MFVIDDILLSPMKGFMWIVRELHNAAQQEIEGEAERLTHRLSTLYMLLETGGITPEAFDAEEAQILARLDAIGGGDEAGDDTLDEEVDIDEDADELSSEPAAQEPDNSPSNADDPTDDER